MRKKKLWIPEPIFADMVTDANKWAPSETGGVFMGYHADNKDIVITDMVSAGPKATHHRYRFCPDQDYQLEQISEIYMQSNRNITYLGDWHTHPSSTSNLSFIDKRTLTRIATTPEAQALNPIMGILGSHPEKWTLKVVQFVSGQIHIWPFVTCRYSQLPYTVF